MRPQPWTQHAACVPIGPDFTEAAPADQLETCARCPVRAECLDYAITTRAVGVVMGGISIGQRPLRRRKDRTT